MLQKRIVVCLDVKNGKVTKGIKFKENVDIGDPVKMAREYYKQGVDELVFYDITAYAEGRGIMIEVVRKVAREIFIPFCVGGGLGSVEDIRAVLLAGAEKISLNSQAVKNPELISQGARLFGNQCIVAAIDVRRRYDIDTKITAEALEKESGVKDGTTLIPTSTDPGVITLPDGTPCWYEVVIYGGSTPTGIDAIWWAKEVEARGAGEILLTSMETDGEKDGFDIAITKAVSDAVHVPIIASGGVGTLEHFYDGFTKGNADACLAASVFHYGTYTVGDVKKYLHNRGVDVRI